MLASVKFSLNISLQLPVTGKLFELCFNGSYDFPSRGITSTRCHFRMRIKNHLRHLQLPERESILDLTNINVFPTQCFLESFLLIYSIPVNFQRTIDRHHSPCIYDHFSRHVSHFVFKSGRGVGGCPSLRNSAHVTGNNPLLSRQVPCILNDSDLKSKFLLIFLELY